MDLTQKQEWLIARYLRDVGAELGDVSETTCERALSRLRVRIMRKLREAPRSPDEESVRAVLRALGSPRAVAARMLEEHGLEGPMALSTEDRVWLGVCGGIAEYLGMNPGAVRLAAVAVGVTGPLALVAYLVLYAEMYISADDNPDLPLIDKVKLFKYTAGILAALAAFHVGTRVFLGLTGKVYMRVMERQTLPSLEGWDWLEYNASLFVFWAVAALTPVAALSALPLKGEWQRTGDRVLQAGLGLYALLLSLGMASFVVGLILQAVKGLAG